MYNSRGWWYVRYKDCHGKWHSIATGTRDENEAREFEENFMPSRKELAKPVTLIHLIGMFTVPERNPSYIRAKVTGKNYGLRHAQEVARNMRDLLMLLKADRHLGPLSLRKVTRHDCNSVMLLVHGRWGNSCKAHDTFAEFKVCLTYAADQGWIPVSPAQGMDDIHADKLTEVVPMTIGDIRTIISRPDLFRFTTEPHGERHRLARIDVMKMDYALFVLLALTGMRRAEAAALDSSQVCSGIYRGKAFRYIVIDRAYKDDKWTEIGLPKWNLARSVPLPELAYKAIEPYLGDGLVFKGITKARFQNMFIRLKENALIDRIQWEDPEAVEMLSPHKLRHALNTNLVSMMDPAYNSLIEQFMSWGHQEQSRMQRRYTHLVASRLIPVAEEIDSWFSDGAEADSCEVKSLRHGT